MLTSHLKSPAKDMTTDMFDCPIDFIGEPAFGLLPRYGLAGTVIASFSRSCWLETPDSRLFAIADHKSGEGPLTIGVVLPERLTLAEMGVKAGIELFADGADFLVRRPSDIADIRNGPLASCTAGGAGIRTRRWLAACVALSDSVGSQCSSGRAGAADRPLASIG